MTVKRINTDNYPICKVNDVGVICEDTPKTIKYYGSTELEREIPW